jgi:hypothetical protein
VQVQKQSVVDEHTRGMLFGFGWFIIPGNLAMYYQLSRYTHMPLVITMSLSKVRKGLDGFRCAIKIVLIAISFMVFP